MKQTIILKAIFALIPLGVTLTETRESLMLGSVVLGVHFVLALFFSLCRRAFPKQVFEVSVFLFIATLVQTSRYFVEWNPLWGLSILLLFNAWEERPWLENLKETVRLSSVFFAMLILVVLGRELFFIKLGWIGFSEPFGFFLILGLFVFAVSFFKTRLESTL